MRWLPLTLLLCTGCVPGFDGFQLVDDAGSPERDASLEEDAGRADASVDGGATDAGPTDGGTTFVPTRIDTACDTAWTELTASPGGACGGREVVTVASTFDSLDVALARAPDGTVTVAYNELEGFDFGRIRTVRFHEDAPDSASPGTTVEPESTIGDVVGIDLALATEPPDIHHLAYWLRSDFGHEVRYQTLRDDVLSPVQSIAPGVGRAGVVDVAVDSDRRAVIGWHDDVNGQNGVRRELADESFSTAVTLRTDGDSRIEGWGAMSLRAGSGGRVHVAYQWCLTLAASAPSYGVGSGTMWSAARTLDNRAIANRASGVGVDVTLVGEDVVVAYLDWMDGAGEIRLARFFGSEEPTIEVYLGGLFIADRPGDHPLVIDTDVNGWLHLLVADASSAGTRLQYHRQTRVGGELRWIVDTIAEVAAPPENVRVDMKLGPDRRPHVVYWDPTIGAVRYATVRP